MTGLSNLTIDFFDDLVGVAISGSRAMVSLFAFTIGISETSGCFMIAEELNGL
jgi:hypothetical protein